MAKKDSVKICLNDSCPIDVDMDLVGCTKSCSNHSSCYLFKHKNVGPVGKCFLYGFHRNEGARSDDVCENAVGTTCFVNRDFENQLSSARCYPRLD